MFGYHFGVRGVLVEAGALGGNEMGLREEGGEGWAGVSAAGFLGMIAGLGKV